MNVNRRDFIKAVSVSAAALGLGTVELTRLERALANPSAPSVIWLQGAACTGCSVSFLNRISPTAPTSAADILINSVNLVYHPNIMSLAGEDALAAADAATGRKPYVVVVEGAIPQAYNGRACWIGHWDGRPLTIKEAVTTWSAGAAAVVCVGNCASFGGVPAAPPNPTRATSVSRIIGRQTINIAGCPTHPDWITWAIVQILLGNPIPTDGYGRPTGLFGRTVHSMCPRREDDDHGDTGFDAGECLRERGCLGPESPGNCPSVMWNGGLTWCVDAEAPCLGCTAADFPRSPLLVPRDDD